MLSIERGEETELAFAIGLGSRGPLCAVDPDGAPESDRSCRGRLCAGCARLGAYGAHAPPAWGPGFFLSVSPKDLGQDIDKPASGWPDAATCPRVTGTQLGLQEAPHQGRGGPSPQWLREPRSLYGCCLKKRVANGRLWTAGPKQPALTTDISDLLTPLPRYNYDEEL